MKKKSKQSLFLISIILIAVQCVGFPMISSAEGDPGMLLQMYKEYQQRFGEIENVADISACGFAVIEDQVFPVELQNFGEVSFVPALDREYSRLAFFLAAEDGSIIYKTEQLETNSRNRGELKQPNKGIAAVSFQDVDEDGLTDIVLITSCVNETGAYAGKAYKTGDVLFQHEQGFYRDWRVSDKINRFSMNKSVDFITAFIRDRYSTEFLYTAATKAELLKQGFQIINEQCYPRTFEKLGKLEVVPGTYTMASYDIFMIYLINEDGYIVWSLQPMGDYDNLYALKGINCRDIDGDGMKDIVVLGRYSSEGEDGELAVESDYAIYYQRTGGFYADTEYKELYQCDEKDTMELLIEKARAHWGWRVEE